MAQKSKYDLLMRRRIATTFQQWTEKESITEKEMYAFLYKARGIAKGLGMQHIEYMAADKIAQIMDDSSIIWELDEWRRFLEPFQDVLNSEEDQHDVHSSALREVKQENVADIALETEEQENPEGEVILLIDNDIEFVTNLKNKLEQEGYYVIISLTVSKGYKHFYSMNPDFVLLNINLADNKEDLEKFGAAVRANLTPLALISSEVGEHSRAAAYELGATDFIQKGVLDPDWFVPYLKNRLSFSQKMLIDELTGACNRKFMDRALADLLANYRRYNEGFTVAIIDLDFFKKVNDTHGHIFGDEVLRRLVQVINEHKRKTDMLCRFGGEEFVLCLPKTTDEGAMILLDRIREEFSKEVFVSAAGEFKVTFSAGVVSVNEHNNNKEKILDEADKALYQSKASGRNRVTPYSADLDGPAVKKLQVLVVDDDRLVRTILMRSFADWDPGEGIEVEVHSFKDGEDLLNANWYNANDRYIILLDGIMPKMNGIEVLKHIRADYDDKNIIISMLSARAGEANIVHALELGADDYMLKPFKVPEVLARINRLSKRLLL